MRFLGTRYEHARTTDRNRMHGGALPHRRHDVQIGAGGRWRLCGCDEGRTQKCKGSASTTKTHDALSSVSDFGERLTHLRLSLQTEVSVRRRFWRYNDAMQVTVDIPDDFLPFIVPEGTDAARKLLENSVAAAYRERR